MYHVSNAIRIQIGHHSTNKKMVMIAAIKLVLDYKNGMALTESSTDDANSMKFDSAIFK